MRPQPDQMALDARQFGQQHADPLGARWHFEVEQFLDGQAESQIIGEWREIVHPVGHHQGLEKGLGFHVLLDTGV